METVQQFPPKSVLPNIRCMPKCALLPRLPVVSSYCSMQRSTRTSRRRSSLIISDSSDGEQGVAGSQESSLGSALRKRGRIRSSRADTSRRRIQLRTPESNTASHSAKRKHAISDAESTVHDVNSNLDELRSNELFNELSLDKAFDLVLGAIGGSVTEAQVRRLTSTEAEDQDTPDTANDDSAPEKSDAMCDDSPPDDTMEEELKSEEDQEYYHSIAKYPVPERTRDRDINAHNSVIRTQSVLVDRTDLVSGCTALDLPAEVQSPSLIIPQHLHTLSLCPTNISIACGVEEDDKLLQESIQYKDWIFSAEYLDLDERNRESLLRVSSASDGLDAAECLRFMCDADILSHFVSVSDIGPHRMDSILGICSRFLDSGLPENLLLLFTDLLLRGRDAQLGKGRDSLVYLLSSSGRQMKGRHQYLQYLWVTLLDACRQCESKDGSLLWKIFNKSWFENTTRTPVQSTVSTYVAVDEGIQKLLIALATIAGLFAFRVRCNSDSFDLPKVTLTPNWAAVGVALDRLIDRKYSSITDHGNVLSKFLVRICTEFADRLWKVDEAFMLKVLQSVQTLCGKYDEPCFCQRIPVFLTQFQGISDLRSRRKSIRDYVKTSCDCAHFLAWIYVMQESDVSAKHSAKIVRHSAMAMKSKACSKDPARALAHHLGLTMSIADSIVKTRGGREELLRSMLFSKAPDVSKAMRNPFDFSPKIIDSWIPVLETIDLRCRHLLAESKGVHVYCDYVGSNLTAALMGIERPDTQFSGNVSKREAWRVQQTVFAGLIIKLLTTLVSVLRLVVQVMENGSFSNLSAVDTLLLSLSRFVGRLGKFATGLVSQIRSNKTGTLSNQRKEMLSIIVSFTEQALRLCTLHAQQLIRTGVQESSENAIHRGAQSSSFGHFAKIVQSSMHTALISLMQSPVSVDESEEEFELRLAACRVMAMMIGLCSIGKYPLYTPYNSNQLMKVFSDANVPALNLEARNVVAAPSALNGRLVNQSKKEKELLVQAEFWSMLLDSTWSSSVLSLNEKLEEMAFAHWIIMLVVSFAESEESRLVKALPILSYAIQSAAERNENMNISKWFYKTQYGMKCREIQSIGPAGQLAHSGNKVTELDAHKRLETLVDCLCVVLQSWLSVKVMRLIDFIRVYIKLSSANKARRYNDVKYSQSYFRPSRDLQDGEQALLHTQVLAVLFVVHSSLCVFSAQCRGGRAGNSKGISKLYLTEISESFTKAMNKMRKGRSSEFENAQVHIQILTIVGLATLGADQGDMETQIAFLRFVRLNANAEKLRGLLSWNDMSIMPVFLQRSPFVLGMNTTAKSPHELARKRSIEKSAREWRQTAFHTLVEDPISRSAIRSQEFRCALRCLCEILDPSTVGVIRASGLWANVSWAMKQMERRRQSPDFIALSGAIPHIQSLDKLWKISNTF